MSADVLVVGGGPAGLAAAIAARMKNLRVAVVDPRQPPIDKACGEGLLPEAVAALRQLGVSLDSSLAAPFAGFRFADGHSSATAKIPRGKAFGLRRTVLHRLLIDRATEMGVSLLWGTRLSSLDSHNVAVDGHLFPCRWIVGADGQNSNVRQSARLGPARYRPSRFGFRLHYAIAPWTDLVEVHWGSKTQMIVTPTATNEICISLFSNDSGLRVARALDRFPEIAERLRAARPVSTEAGAVTSLGRARVVARGNVALVGDASCMVDAVSGQGLSLAFQQALDLADALARGDLALYEAAHPRLTRNAMRMTRLMLLMNASAALRRKVLRLFAARPALFAKMISIHTSSFESDPLNAAQILDLGLRVLLA